jgi:excisionase family DNA binding protein
MQSLTIKEAAEFLKCGVSTLQRKAKSGEIPARKIGKKWVFIREHLADFVSGRYTQAREGLRVLDGGLTTQESNQWQSTNKKTATSGTSTSSTQTANEYANLLGLKTNNKRKNSTIS